MIVRIWEVRGRPEGFTELLNWVCDVAVTSIEQYPQHIDSEIFTSTDHRLMVVSKWRGSEPVTLADPPGHLVEHRARWRDFASVDR